MIPDPTFEFCVMAKGTEGVHTGLGWPREICEEWIAETERLGWQVGDFYVARRYVGPWHHASLAPSKYKREAV